MVSWLRLSPVIQIASTASDAVHAQMEEINPDNPSTAKLDKKAYYTSGQMACY